MTELPGTTEQAQDWHAPVPAQRINVLGIVGLSILVLGQLASSVLFSVYLPLSAGASLLNADPAFLTLISSTLSLGIWLSALGLGIGGLLQRRATRWRWAAIGTVVAASLGLFSYLTAWVLQAIVGLIGNGY